MMTRLAVALGFWILAAAGIAAADDVETSLYQSERGVVELSACKPFKTPVAVALLPAYAIGGQSLEDWFQMQIRARILGWSGSYPLLMSDIRRGSSFLQADASFSANGHMWEAVFYANAQGGRAQMGVVVSPNLAGTLDNRTRALRASVEQAYASDFVLLPEALAGKPFLPPDSVADENGVVGRLTSNSLKWLLGGLLENAPRHYVLLANGTFYEARPGNGTHITEGYWIRTDDGSYQVAWADGSFDLVPATCFSSEGATAATTGTATPSDSADEGAATPDPAGVAGGNAGGQDCHNELRTVTQYVAQNRCDYSGHCTFGMVPVQQQVYQDVCE